MKLTHSAISIGTLGVCCGQASAASASTAPAQVSVSAPPPFWGIGIIPFVAILIAIAVFPMLSFTRHWWEHNRNRLLTSVVLGGATLIYLVLTQGSGVIVPTLQHALLDEYVPFIILLFSLFVISGGIRLSGDLRATPVGRVPDH